MIVTVPTATVAPSTIIIARPVIVSLPASVVGGSSVGVGVSEPVEDPEVADDGGGALVDSVFEDGSVGGSLDDSGFEDDSVGCGSELKVLGAIVDVGEADGGAIAGSVCVEHDSDIRARL